MKLFSYGTLNVHDIQRELWGEAKEGIFGRIVDYELKLWPDTTIFYAEPKFGEYISGKMYELTKDQVDATDIYEGPDYQRVSLFDKEHDWFWVYVRRDEPKPKVKRHKHKHNKRK